MKVFSDPKKERFEEFFQEFKPALDPSEAATEASRCLNCFDAPCIQACPTHINIPQFIHRIASEDIRGATKTILDSNSLGLSCALSCPTEVLCEGACVYQTLNKKPISIGKLQRFAVESSYKNGEVFYSPGPNTGKKVALIGAGPSSLACAHELRKSGHKVVIFEKASIPGGLNTQGIAPYKMKANTSLWEIEKIAEIGVEFQFHQELGRNLDLNQLLTHFDAVFLGLGLGSDSLLDIPGSKHPSILGAVDFISKLKTSSPNQMQWISQIQTALVIGGGNTALDACRELKQIGVPNVMMSYRRGESEMSGYAHELKWARQEGVTCLFHTLPKEFVPTSNPASVETILGLTTVSKNGEFTLTQEQTSIKAELVLIATGQSKLEKLLDGIPHLKFKRGCLEVDPKTGATGHPQIFAGGDLTNGGKEVVNAVAEGKQAALAIHQLFVSQSTQPSRASTVASFSSEKEF